jgi:hypothetical protein
LPGSDTGCGKLTEIAEKLCRILATAEFITLKPACGAPVHQLDTLPSFDDIKKMAEKLCRILATAAFITLKPVGHQLTDFFA